MRVGIEIEIGVEVCFDDDDDVVLVRAVDERERQRPRCLESFGVRSD